MENTPASSRELLKQIADAKLLEKCGGPYLDEEALLSLPTLSEAVNIIGGMQLDATAHSQ